MRLSTGSKPSLRRTITLLLVLSSVIVLHPVIAEGAPPGLQIGDNATARGIDSSTYSPIERTQSFYSNDKSVYSWVKLVNVPQPSHRVKWIWLTPQMNVYKTDSATIMDPGPGRTWNEYYVWANIGVKGADAGQLLGFWQVEVYLDDVKSLVQTFTIDDATTPAQPMYGFSWPSYDIKVYIQPDPAYAREDVINAMKQWNYSQIWFQATYVLESRPAFNLIVSNNDVSGIRVLFNQTRSNPDFLGYAYHQYFYDASGAFTKVTCTISLALAETDGTRFNDVLLENLAQHELGHCLGLDHVRRAGDTMNPTNAVSSDLHTPSTLNLFALSEISTLKKINTIPRDYTLPDRIQYLKSPRYDSSEIRGTIQMADNATAKGVDSSSLLPIQRTQSFLATDPVVYSWLKLVNVSRPSHMVTWIWLTPQGEQYWKASYSVPDPGPGKFWPNYFVWSSIYINGSKAAKLPGQWKIEVQLDEQLALIQGFLVEGTATTPRIKLASFPVSVDNANFLVYVKSNSTISNFRFNQAGKAILFSVTGETGTIGSTEVTFPNSLLSGNFTVTLDGSTVLFKSSQNSTHTLLSTTYQHGNSNLRIMGTLAIPEFPYSILTSTLAMAFALTLPAILRFAQGKRP